MSNYLLDTDICIFFLKGHQKVKEKIQEVGIANCYISEITIGELFYGAFNSEHKEKHIKEVFLQFKVPFEPKILRLE